MQEKKIAFVLSNFFPLQQKLSVITQKHGKIFAQLKNKSPLKRIARGSFIFCTISQHNGTHIILDNIEAIQSCTPTSQEAIYWLHHILELCHYFIPPQTPSEKTFYWIHNFIKLIQTSQQHNIPLTTSKKIYILYFLELVGALYEPLKASDYKQIKQIHEYISQQQKDPKKLATKINIDEQKKLNLNIINQLKEHPCFHRFKTLRFVYPF